MLVSMELLLGLFVLVALAGVSMRWGADSRDYVQTTAAWPFRSGSKVCRSPVVPEGRDQSQLPMSVESSPNIP